jgi:hypothetical protein
VDQARIAALEAELARLRGQRFEVELYGPEGDLLQKSEFGAGKPLKLKLIPVK